MAKNFDHLSHLKSNATRDVTSEEFFGLTPTSDNSEDSGSSPIKMNLAKRPTADNLVEGEIAVNYLKGHETLSIKNSEGEIVGFISENEIQENNEILVKGISQEAKDRIDACEAISKKVETHEAESAYQTIEVTMEELYNLKSTEKLKPGNSYRITDYNTKTNTSMTDIRSQEFHYDVIVTATSTTTLSEIAKAAKAKVGSASSQFDDCNLDAWELRFRMGFDKEEFPWAYYSGDTTKYGVVYYMKDEHGNEAPYDFKNIQFKRYKMIKGDDSTSDSLDGVYAAPSADLTMGDVWGYGYTVSSDDFNWFYTFSALKVTWDSTNHKFTAPTSVDSTSTILDASIANVNNLYNTYVYNLTDCEYCSTTENLDYNLTCSNNVIKPCYVESKTVHNLNNNIMLGWYGDYSSMESDYQTGTSDPGLTYMLPHDNYFASDCKNNTLSIGSCGNKFGEGCFLNTVGNFSSSDYDTICNSFGRSCTRNSFGKGSSFNFLGNNCNDNMFNINVAYNYAQSSLCRCVFGKNVKGNKFGHGNNFHTLSGYDDNNTFEDYCVGITLTGNCDLNFFGKYSSEIVINAGTGLCYGNYFYGQNENINLGLCNNNIFYGSSRITMGNSSSNNKFWKCANITLGTSCTHNVFDVNCTTITLDAGCTQNTFATSCNQIELGGTCSYNVFGPSCVKIYVYSGSTGTTRLGYFQNNVFETNKYLTIRTTQTTSRSNVIRNNYFALGINNTTTAKTITIDTLNATYKTTYQNANSTSVSV